MKCAMVKWGFLPEMLQRESVHSLTSKSFYTFQVHKGQPNNMMCQNLQTQQCTLSLQMETSELLQHVWNIASATSVSTFISRCVHISTAFLSTNLLL